MASEHVLDIPVRRHVLTSERPFRVVLDGIYDGISQPDIGALFATLAASTSYEQFAALVSHAQGSAGLMRFLHLDDDHVLALDPQASGQAGRRLVRLIAGNPVTMGQMTRHLPAAGSYAPVTILIQELPGGGTQVAYDTVAARSRPTVTPPPPRSPAGWTPKSSASCTTRPACRPPQPHTNPAERLSAVADSPGPRTSLPGHITGYPAPFGEPDRPGCCRLRTLPPVRLANAAMVPTSASTASTRMACL